MEMDKTKKEDIKMKPNESADWAEIIDKHSLFIKVVFLVVLSILEILLYDYNRSFMVHQETLCLVHNYNISNDAKFHYEVHVGHDGTMLKPTPFLKKMGPAPVASSSLRSPSLDTASLTSNNPHEQFTISPWILIQLDNNLYFSFTNPSFFLLLTLSLALLLVHFVTKKIGGN